jgi:hypothetical protein
MRIEGWRHFWRALLFGWCLILSGALQAQTIESVLSPGPVIQGHVKVENECKECHSRFDRSNQDTLCVVCHKEVGADVRANTGLHGKRDNKQQCRACHGEHKGRNAKLASFDTKTFDHRRTDFELHDKHTTLECAKCHVAGKRWAEAPGTCVACHTKDDTHKGGLGRKCEDCHNAKSWKDVRFDHDTQTKFALLDKHATVKCESCHAQGRYKDTPMTCVGCHKKDDHHKGQYGDKCDTCHNAKNWKTSIFNHDTDTRYALKDKHRSIKCEACHGGPVPLYKQKLATDCVSCHLKDDKHKTTLGRQCGDCHTERSWKEPPGFDHSKSKFPLLGAHIKTACKECHADALYRKTPGRCVDCHKKVDKHETNLGDKCETCHAEQKWKDVQGRFDHDRSKFKLRNAHAARNVKCQDCHENLRGMRGTPTDCFSCHARDDRHEGSVGKQCDSCHRDTVWKVERYDHNKTKFALVGRHQVVQCASCHLSLRFKEAASDCLSCHRKDDHHKATLGAKCESCHNARAWSLWDFDHNRSTRYKLEASHQKVSCLACHAKPAPAGAAIAPVGSDCMACHRKDDIHEGQFGRNCEQCHAPTQWKAVRSSSAAKPAADKPAGAKP